MRAWLDRYAPDPVLFVREVLAADPEPYQEELLRAIAAGKRRISIRSGHGVGKTATLAWAIVWHIATRYPQKTVCTAPTSQQLFDALASEVKAWINRLPPAIQSLFEVKSERIELKAAPAESFVAFNTSRPELPEAMAGVHSDNVLLIADEASGIPEKVFEAAAGSMSGANAITLLAGNPVRASGLFYRSHTKLKADWYTIHVSCVNSRRVDPQFIAEMQRDYGERSNAYRVRVLGEFPLADDDTVIPLELVEAAADRDVEAFDVREIWGVDVARFGNDASALARRKGNKLVEPVKVWHGLDTMELAGRINELWVMTPAHERPSDICIDVIGMGAGVYDRCRQLGLPVRPINVSESPALGEKFRNLRSELWWKGREWFEELDCSCKDDDLKMELIAVKYAIQPNGKIAVEGKSEMKKRGLESPNRADAFLLTLSRDAIAARGGSKYGRTSWNEPIRRKLALV